MIDYLSFEIDESITTEKEYITYINRQKKLKDLIYQVQRKKELDLCHTYYKDGIDIIEPCYSIQFKKQVNKEGLKITQKLWLCKKWLNSILYKYHYKGGFSKLQVESLIMSWGVWLCYIDVEEFMNNFNPNKLTMDDYYTRKVKHIWNMNKLRNLFDNDNVLINEHKRNVINKHIGIIKKSKNLNNVIELINKHKNNISVNEISFKLNLNEKTIRGFLKEKKIKLITSKNAEIIRQLDYFFEGLKNQSNPNKHKLTVSLISSSIRYNRTTVTRIIKNNKEYLDLINEYNSSL